MLELFTWSRRSPRPWEEWRGQRKRLWNTICEWRRGTDGCKGALGSGSCRYRNMHSSRKKNPWWSKSRLKRSQWYGTWQELVTQFCSVRGEDSLQGKLEMECKNHHSYHGAQSLKRKGAPPTPSSPYHHTGKLPLRLGSREGSWCPPVPKSSKSIQGALDTCCIKAFAT